LKERVNPVAQGSAVAVNAFGAGEVEGDAVVSWIE
jgi:hypothetical protein